MPTLNFSPKLRFDLVSALAALGAFILFLSYWAIFYLTTDGGFIRAAVVSLNNTVPAIALAWLIHLALERYVWPARMAVRLLTQMPLSILFALTWYLAILVTRELRGDWLTEGFSIQPFVPVAFAWQMFQGITFYALAALASLSIWLSRKLRAATNEVTSSPNQETPTLLLRTGEGAESVSTDTLVSISGAGDYSEVRMAGRTIYSTTTLSEFEARLPQDKFLRAHRSHLVRLDAIERSEPAGNGRTTLHLIDGRSIVTSRAGTRLLREAIL